MRHIKDSYLSFTPDHSGIYVVRFRVDGVLKWIGPIIGWLIVANESYSNKEWSDGDDTEGVVSTLLSPAILDKHGCPTSAGEFLGELSGPNADGEWSVIHRDDA